MLLTPLVELGCKYGEVNADFSRVRVQLRRKVCSNCNSVAQQDDHYQILSSCHDPAHRRLSWLSLTLTMLCSCCWFRCMPKAQKQELWSFIFVCRQSLSLKVENTDYGLDSSCCKCLLWKHSRACCTSFAESCSSLLNRHLSDILSNYCYWQHTAF